MIAGAAFASAWSPCLGPILASILAFAAREDSVAKGGALLAVYSLGLAVPFMLSAVAFDRVTGAFRWLRDHYQTITAISGVVLVAVGLLILTENFTWLNSQVTNVQDALGLQALGRGL